MSDFENKVSIKEYISALFESLTEKISSTEKNLSNKLDMLEKNHDEKIETVKKDIFNVMRIQAEHSCRLTELEKDTLSSTCRLTELEKDTLSSTCRLTELEKDTSSSNGQKRLVKIALPVILTIISVIFGILAFARG